MSLKNQQIPPNEVTPNVIIGGDAVGMGGFVTKMNEGSSHGSILSVHGASALPAIGGNSTDTVRRLRDPDFTQFVSFAQIDTHATGSYDPSRPVDKAQVSTHAAVKGLRLVDRFEADSLEAKLYLKHHGDQRQPTITWEGSNFSKLTLDGYDVAITIDQELQRLTTLNDLQTAFKRSEFFDRYQHRFFRNPAARVSFGSELPSFGKAKYCKFSIVEKITSSHPKAIIRDHILALEGFGAIYFGEILVLPESRQLTLARFELGCRNEGHLVFCDVISRGESCPP